MILTLALTAALFAQQGPGLFGAKPPSEKDIVILTGDSIPEWSTWGFAFRDLSTGKNLPSEFYQLATVQQRTMISEAAAESSKNDKELEARQMKDLTKLGEIQKSCLQEETDPRKLNTCYQDKSREVFTAFNDYELAYRQRTLDIRDRLVQRLESAPEVQNALIIWVRERKAGQTARIPKSELSRYLQPR